jgi:hypothetical protein
MPKTYVNISVNKSFRTCAEQLLTGNYQFIHELLTDLSTHANRMCEQLKRQSDRMKVVRMHHDLTKAALTGYRAAIQDDQMPKPTDVPADCEQAVKYLIPPMKQLGYATGCHVIEYLIKKGAHKSNLRDKTEKPEPPNPS